MSVLLQAMALSAFTLEFALQVIMADLESFNFPTGCFRYMGLSNTDHVIRPDSVYRETVLSNQLLKGFYRMDVAFRALDFLNHNKLLALCLDGNGCPTIGFEGA